ncbi:MAG: universal stress protein [Bacteroidia bacterium]|nr:universal stress protein [Sphingobacteriaceae bacterium]MBP9068331.1 universal stress protein [Bacteroidia bacterium]
MRTVIAGTDFSTSSINACRYAAELAQISKCKLIIFNLFVAPVIHSNIGLYGFSYESIKKTSKDRTDKLITQLKREFPKINISVFATNGAFENELKKFTKAHKVEAAVMGLETKKRISKFIYGSHGINLVGKIDCPVIIVPSGYRTHKFSRVLLAVDNNEKLIKSSLKGFERFIKDTGSRIKVLHVRTDDEIFHPVTNTVSINKRKLAIDTIRAKDIQDGVKKYCSLGDISLVAIISKKHSLFYNLFSESNTKKIAFVSKLPVMSIHE